MKQMSLILTACLLSFIFIGSVDAKAYVQTGMKNVYVASVSKHEHHEKKHKEKKDHHKKHKKKHCDHHCHHHSGHHHKLKPKHHHPKKYTYHGCTYHSKPVYHTCNHYRVVTKRPANPNVVVHIQKPGDGYVLIKGEWRYDKKYNEYVYVEPRWVKKPSTKAMWISGAWSLSNGGYVWLGGKWKL
ncbi:hypothetical protein K5X82_12215 [Halosquirtibacter xylanolyticus]|uniref:hypothetical protein n=1 Tax=Halosquirtibacter xylanolyticus TaxID=3374599 RepID=UPI003747D96F|nr:hypothetical protein K5X82_12215 [Prolixibacteraceae bacterium]